MKPVLTIDIGGTKIASALIKARGKISHYQEMPSFANKPPKIFQKRLTSLIDSYTSQAKLKAIALSIAGHIDYKKGIIIQSPNFHKRLQGYNLKKALKKYKAPVYMDNDVNCFALGEAVYGKGKKHSTVVGVTLGTGIGGGIVINKKLYHGKNNLAGEFGFYQLQNKFWGEGSAANKKYLWQGLYNIIHSFDPDIIIIGGGISNIPGLISGSGQKLQKKLYYQAFKRTPIKKSKLQYKANLLGAYHLTTH